MYNEVIQTLVSSKAWKATKYLSEKEVIRAVRTRFGNKFNPRRIEVTVSRCKPNFLERQFIVACKKAGEPFPVKKIQLKFIPKQK